MNCNGLPLTKILFLVLFVLVGLLPALAIPYQIGDVFVAVSDGKVQHYNAAGVLLETLDTRLPSFTTGMAFDSRGNLYVTNFGAGTVSRFDPSGNLLGTFGSGYSGAPESILFDRNGNAYVGSVAGDNRIRKFDPTGTPLATFSAATENVGTDWIDLSPDQCTMFYTSEGPHVKRFNVCNNTQLSDFNTTPLPSSSGFALRILPDGGVLVADEREITRLNSAGNVVQTYNSPGQVCWFALNLDPDGKSFWSADFCSSTVHKFDIQSGAELIPPIHTGTAIETVFGLVVFGELSASRPVNLPATFGPAGSQTNASGSFADPVNTGTGNYYLSQTDFVIPGRGLSLVFTRAYNSLDTYSGPLGPGWTHSYNIFARINANGTVTVKEADGHEVLFVPTGGGSYAPETKGVFDKFVQNADGTFALTRKNQTKLTFSPAGKLLTVTDRNGNQQSLFYDGAGDLVEVSDGVGRSLSFTYDASNRILEVTDPLGRNVMFSYNAEGNLATSTDPAGGITQCAYDAGHRVVSVKLPNGQFLLQNTYDAIGRIISQSNGRGATSTFTYGSPSPTDTTITDARGNQTIHSYDPAFRILKITDPASGLVSFTYDDNNDRTKVVNQNGQTSSFSYDGLGNLTAITDATGKTSTFAYDPQNDLLLATDAQGNSTAFSYDLNGNLTTIRDAAGNTTNFAYDGLGQLTSRTDAVGNVTAYSYDAQGNLVRVTDALNHATLLGFDAISRLMSITDPNGHTATAGYDVLSRLVRIGDALGDETDLAYDSIGNLVKLTDANGNTTSYAYDAVNNLVSVTDALGHVTKYSYDADNNRIGFTNAKGNSASYSFDALNRLTAVIDPLLFVTAYSYDGVGNVVAVKDANGTTNRFTYDAMNRLTNIAYGDGQAVAYAYDGNGNRTTMVDPHGTTGYQYDALNRLIAVTFPGAKTVKYSYNAVGNRQSVSYPDGKSVAYSYDPVNRLVQALDWLGRATTYGYDPAGNLTSLAYPNHSGISFAYDAANRLISVNNAVSKPGSDASAAHHFGTFQYLLDAVGNRLQVSNGKGKVLQYSYDKLYELTGVSTVASGDPEDDEDDPELVASYVYDAVGNRIQQITPDGTLAYVYDADDRLLSAGFATFGYDPNGNQTSVARTAESIPIVYSYDAANRLVSALGGYVNSSFSYDGDGNRVSQSVPAGTYNYVNDIAAGLPVVLQESGPDGNISYAYGLGLISESSVAFNFFYQYDGLGSVVGLTNSNGDLKQRYVYDAWGNTLHIMGSNNIGTENKFRFTGEALDPGTGLYYLRARYYSPETAVFNSRDHFGLVVGATRTSQYSYGLNNPVRLVDPSGEFPGLAQIGNFLGEAANAGGAALILSGAALAKGGVSIIPSFIQIPILTPTQNAVSGFFGSVELNAAMVLNANVASLEGVSLSREQNAELASQVVSITDFSSDVLTFVNDLPSALKDINKLQTAINNANVLGRSIILPSIVQAANVYGLLSGAFGVGTDILQLPCFFGNACGAPTAVQK